MTASPAIVRSPRRRAHLDDRFRVQASPEMTADQKMTTLRIDSRACIRSKALKKVDAGAFKALVKAAVAQIIEWE